MPDNTHSLFTHYLKNILSNLKGGLFIFKVNSQVELKIGVEDITSKNYQSISVIYRNKRFELEDHIWKVLKRVLNQEEYDLLSKVWQTPMGLNTQEQILVGNS